MRSHHQVLGAAKFQFR